MSAAAKAAKSASARILILSIQTWPLQHEPEVRRGEAVEQREDRREVARGETVPGGERRRVLLDGGRRDEAAARVRVVGAAERERRVGAVEVPAAHRRSE